MGQYYTPIIKRENDSWLGFKSHDYGNGFKIMEHSYIGNNFTETVVKQLLEKPGYLAWVGDYAEIGDVKSDSASEFIEKERKFGNGLKYNKPKKVNLMENSLMLIIFNHTKKEYINMFDYCNKQTPDECGCIIHPLPLLTAIGNGKGGGDYYSDVCEDMVGYWACDLIEAGWFNDSTKYYKDITEQVLFKE